MHTAEFKVVFHGARNQAMFDPSTEANIANWKRSVTGYGVSDLDAFKGAYNVLAEMGVKDVLQSLDEDFEDGVIEPSVERMAVGWGNFHAVTICWGGLSEQATVSADADDGDAA